MNYLIKIALFSILLFISKNSFAQFHGSNQLEFPKFNSKYLDFKDQTNIQTCQKNFVKLKNDSLKVSYLINYIDTCYNNLIWPKLNEFLISFIEFKLQQNNNSKEKKYYLIQLGNTYINRGYHYGEIGKVNLQLLYYNKALELFKKTNYIKGLSICYNNLGFFYDKKGTIHLALENYLKSLKIKELLKDTIGIANTLGNLGFNYSKIENYEKADSYFQKSLKLLKKVNDSYGIINIYNHLGTTNFKKSKKVGYQNEVFLKLAIDYYQQALKLSIEINDIIGQGESHLNIGSYFEVKRNFTQSIYHFEKALELYKQQDDIKGQIEVYNSLSEIYLYLNKIKKAEDYAKISLNQSNKLGFPLYISESSYNLYKIFRYQNNYKEALKYHEIYFKMLDSVTNEEVVQKNIELNLNYVFEKEKLIDSINNAKQQKISDLKIKNQQLELRQKKTLNYSLIGGIIFMVLFLYLIYKKFKETAKQKEIIQEQKRIVTDQKIVVEEQHKEITDSIKYAERIQGAILPPDQKWQQILPNSFVLNKPKDILSGDFYWIAETERHIFVAAADCTGHGVPGALISIVNFNLLNKAVLERGLELPSDILDAVNQWLTESLNQTIEESSIRDGMDIALISINKMNGDVLYSGANNPLYLFNNSEMIEYKGDKQPVGGFIDVNSQHFTTKEIPTKFGDTIYLFSDGFADQFGGTLGKKYKYKQLKEKLFEAKELPLEKQKEFLNQEFRTWRGNYEQTDDVLIIGIKF